MQTCHGASGCCWLWMVGIGLGWGLLASTLLYFTWNKVVVAMTQLKKATFVQALLVVATGAILCAPCLMSHRMATRGHCSGKTGHCSEQKSGAPCPYERSSDGNDDESDDDSSTAPEAAAPKK